jgi:hypothetical protein
LAALCVVPAIVLWISTAIAGAAGVRWINPFYDPDYHYLLNALNLAEGAAPRHTDHPGTTLHELGAVILLARHAVVGSDAGLRDQVLRDPEGGCEAISVCLRGLYALALLALGWCARRLTGSLVCAMAAQAASALSVVGLLSLWRADPEPLLMTMALFMGSLVLRAASEAGPVRTRWAAIFGVLAGLGVATKVTFFPLGALPLWALGSRRRAALYLGAALVTFTIAVAPILSQARRVLAWLTLLLVNDGRYGASHGHTFLDPSWAALNLRLMLRNEPVAPIAAAASAVLLMHLRFGGRWPALPGVVRKAAGALACVSFVELAQFVLVAKHPGVRYLVPALVLPGLNVALAYTILREAYGPIDRRVGVALGAAGLLTAAVWIGVRLRHEWALLHEQSVGSRAARQAAVDQAARDGSLIVTQYGSSSPVFGLLYADAWAGRRYRADLGRLYPNEITLDDLTREFINRGQAAPQDQMIAWAAQGKLLFQYRSPSLPADFEYDQVMASRWEGVYRARPRAKNVADGPAPPP